MIFNVINIIPVVSVTVRRLHDVNRSGWWIFIMLTIIGVIPFYYWVLKRSDKQANRFGIC